MNSKTTNKKKSIKKVKKQVAPLKVTKTTNLGELLQKYPQTAEVLIDYGLHCVGCFASNFDTIEQGAKIHGMADEEILEMVERVNEVIEHGE